MGGVCWKIKLAILPKGSKAGNLEAPDRQISRTFCKLRVVHRLHQPARCCHANKRSLARLAVIYIDINQVLLSG